MHPPPRLGRDTPVTTGETRELAGTVAPTRVGGDEPVARPQSDKDRVQDGVRTNGVITEVPQSPIIMVCGKLYGNCDKLSGTSGTNVRYVAQHVLYCLLEANCTVLEAHLLFRRLS